VPGCLVWGWVAGVQHFDRPRLMVGLGRPRRRISQIYVRVDEGELQTCHGSVGGANKALAK
jgi:hypothetical protein